jgi:hypothetical protein
VSSGLCGLASWLRGQDSSVKLSPCSSGSITFVTVSPLASSDARMVRYEGDGTYRLGGAQSDKSYGIKTVTTGTSFP